MNIAKYIDHTLLKQNATKNEILRIIEEAKKYQFASVCINPCWVRLAAEELKGSAINVCTVIGFPLGAGTSAVKAFEAEKAIQDGAREIDMVMNVGALKSGDREYVEKDIRAVVDAARGKALVKVIIEACLLSDEEKTLACQLAVKAGADYVKTSTGFSSGGATAEDVALMRRAVGKEIGVKAAGGIHTKEEAETMIASGATRIGTSSGTIIMNEN
ncbi:deoxyribose-phosphate aldolase [Sporolactobacillus sp. CQH2019]|uniref:deoxyribose-phosphate aldolase n=1 Tax=Sporolactobacillus sp. CQH2019 TaxID=3023512 RepID=UPI00236748BE|nr:deoxyribose-phosphate aldolase [Sporolactobacillus sp. CQH2019]MDD9148875.1 deoxyribose-phosphate aldolase [Sporolactobacillus sp. CQH2019]